MQCLAWSRVCLLGFLQIGPWLWAALFPFSEFHSSGQRAGLLLHSNKDLEALLFYVPASAQYWCPVAGHYSQRKTWFKNLCGFTAGTKMAPPPLADKTNRWGAQSANRVVARCHQYCVSKTEAQQESNGVIRLWCSLSSALPSKCHP